MSWSVTTPGPGQWSPPRVPGGPGHHRGPALCPVSHGHHDAKHCQIFTKHIFSVKIFYLRMSSNLVTHLGWCILDATSFVYSH